MGGGHRDRPCRRRSCGGAVTEPVLEIAGLTKEYPGSPPVRALDGIDLTIERGEAVAIIGPSGSGKSTLLHMMGTLDRPTSGSIAIAGRNLDGLSDDELSAVRSRHIGFVFQQFHLLPGYTALDNVADGLLYRGTPLEERRRLGRTALERVGLADRARHHAEKLSGGERQRVAVARALVGRPDIILADEPTGNLDSKMSDAVIELLSDLHRVGITLVVITHEPDIAHRFARTVELRDGRVVHDRSAA
ncbi:MAG TPA: ABC transporter ATP-binding protein [Actinobacteria bacterium]|nr:ABC transporter ATP-binding protein [Actinomycetota bacterium]